MALIKCKQCGHQVSTQAPACPSCGARPSSGGFGYGLGLIIVLGACWYFLAPDGSLQRIIDALRERQTASDTSGAAAPAVTPPPPDDSQTEPQKQEPTPKEVDPNDPRSVADDYIESLKEQGTVKDVRFLMKMAGLTPGDTTSGAYCVVYALDYITEGGFRREGKYVIVVYPRKDGNGYFVTRAYPWQYP
jgi:hypothetical protein